MRALGGVSVLVLSMGLTAACGEPTASSEVGDEAHELGHVALALVAQGPDGSTYYMPSDFRLRINRVDDGQLVTVVYLENDEELSMRFPVEAGDYTATFENLLDEQGNLVLWRLAEDGEEEDFEPVSAEFLTANPLPFSVTPGVTTALPVRFGLATLGDVVFSAGMLDVQVQLDNSANLTQSAGFVGRGTCALTTAASRPSTLNPILSGVRSVPTGSPVTVDYEVERTGDWELLPDEICTQVRATWVGANQEQGVLHLLFNESTGGLGRLCFDENSVILNVERSGAPNSPSLVGELPPITRSTFRMSGRTAQPLMEGGTLFLSRLRAPITLTQGFGFAQIVDPAANSAIANANLTGTFTLKARL